MHSKITAQRLTTLLAEVLGDDPALELIPSNSLVYFTNSGDESLHGKNGFILRLESGEEFQISIVQTGGAK